ncbi:MAG: AI-2E family transporter [Bacteroidaceae bacterium]|nr:AI-2E family transporter [Bacteroidaceae bacterium]
MDKQDFKNWYRGHKRLISYVIAACIVILFYSAVTNSGQFESGMSKVMGVLSPFIFGAILAYLLRPACNCVKNILNKVKFMRNLPKLVNLIAVLSAYIFGLGIIVLFFVAVVPPLADSVVNLVESLPTVGKNIVDYVEQMAAENEMLRTVVNELYTRANTILTTEIIPSVNDIVDFISEGATSVFDLLKTLFIGLIVSVYLLADKSRLKSLVTKTIDNNFSPAASKAIREELHFVDKTFTRYITGTILDALIVGVVTYIFALIVGLPEPMLLAATIAVTNVIPIVGPFIGAIPTALIVLAYAPDKFLMYCIYLLAMQQLDGHVLVPKVLGSAVGISGLTALFAIVVGGGLFGVTGMVLGVPVLTVILDIWKKVMAYRQAKKKEENIDITDEGGTDEETES